MPRVLSRETIQKIREVGARYPSPMAAVVPSLHMVMDEVGYISSEATLDVAEVLDVPPTRINEVATFYTMFYTEPIGRHTVKICRNLACQLRGADKVIERAKEILGIELGQTTADGRVTLDTDECLASCGTGPMLWHRRRVEKNGKVEAEERICECLTLEKLEKLLKELE